MKKVSSKKYNDFYLILMVWIILILVFFYIKLGDLDISALQEIFGKKTSRSKIYLIVVFYAVIEGSVFSIFQVFIYPKVIKSKSFVLDLFFRSLIFLTVSFILILLVSLKYSENGYIKIEELHLFLKDSSLWIFFLMSILIHLLTDFILILKKNIGTTYFRYLMKIRYSIPVLENRAFMFLDLVSSTPIAENIGHIKFSKLLQDCFADLSKVLQQNQAEIYQYVGDEAVIRWYFDSNLNKVNCLKIYFDYCNLLEQKRKVYLDRYNIQPEFKASLHCGIVTTALVGEFKSEIVHHGDVLNTASRIQSVCKELGCNILVSEDYYKSISFLDHPFDFKKIEDVKLKGKKQTYSLYAPSIKH